MRRAKTFKKEYLAGKTSIRSSKSSALSTEDSYTLSSIFRYSSLLSKKYPPDVYKRILWNIFALPDKVRIKVLMKTSSGKKESDRIAAAVPGKQNGQKLHTHLQDNRAQQSAQAALQAVADGSRQMKYLQAMQKTADLQNAAGCAAPVLQRRMGLEAEMRRVIKNPANQFIDEGDTQLIDHQYFTLVTDHFQGTSNLEFVMKHFDQLAGNEADAIDALRNRIQAMHAFAQQLYAQNNRRLGDIPGVGHGPLDVYRPNPVDYTDNFRNRIRFNSQDAVSAAPPEPDDNRLYVHYTVGFHPRHWLKMVRDIHAVTRPDTASSRPGTLAGHALNLANSYTNPALSPVEIQEAKGHLALMYMEMSVWVDRTVDTGMKRAKFIRDRYREEVEKIQKEIADIKSNPGLNILQKDSMLEPLRKKLKSKKAILLLKRNKVQAISDAKQYSGGQPKNKIAALPRAMLSQRFAILSPNVQRELQRSQEEILDKFAEHLERTLNLDLNESVVLENEKLAMEAELGDFLKAGLGSGQAITQQVLFGGMNEVGIDNSSVANPNLLPLEFRNIYNHRVSWDELLADATKILRWSRDPDNRSL